MIGWIRNIVIIFLILSVIYVTLSMTSRFKQQRRLKFEYEAEHSKTPEDEYIAKGMRKYNRSFKPKLIFGVYLVPFAIMALLIYLSQYT